MTRREPVPRAAARAPAGDTQRVSKILAARGICSRREADRLIAAGCVAVDGVVVEQGAKAALDAVIDVSAAGRDSLASSLTLALHKPVGIVSTMAQGNQTEATTLITRANAAEVVDEETMRRVLASRGLAVAGRLDRASRGLMIVTDDGVVARALIGGNRIAKRYLVTLAADVADGQVERLNRPMRLDERRLLPMKVERRSRRVLRFELVEGMKHQIRRCCGKVGLEVVDLMRDAIGPIQLGDLAPARWRPLSRGEVAAVRASVVSSGNA